MFLLLSSMLFLSVFFAVPFSKAEVLQEVTVKEGDTLWSVSNYYLKNPQSWPEILRYNNLPSSDPNIILPGMRLRVPILLIKENLRAAHLIYILNDVRYRRRAKAEWTKSTLDMELFNNDGLRTFQESKAKVKFFSGEILQLDENSLIILRPEEKQEEVNLLSGGVRASRAKIIASDTIVDPRIEPKGPAPDFRTKIREDKTTLVEVYDGIVDVTAQGRTVTLTKGFGTQIKFKEAPSLPTALPPSPDFDLKPSGAKIPGSSISANTKATSGSLELNVQSPATSGKMSSKGDASNSKNQAKVISQVINKYRVQVSTGYNFSAIIADEVNQIQGKAKVDFKKYMLPDGLYYYRIAYVDDLGFEGRFSQPVQFRIDTVPPAINITSLKDNDEIDTEFIIVEGKTEPGSRLQINEKNLIADDSGAFLTALTPKKGRNLVKIVATDQAGNISSKEIIVDKVKTAAKKAKADSHSENAPEKKFSLISAALGVLTAAVIIGVVILIMK